MVISEATCNIAAGYMGGTLIAFRAVTDFLIFMFGVYVVYKIVDVIKNKQRLRMEYHLRLNQDAKQVQDKTRASNRVRK